MQNQLFMNFKDVESEYQNRVKLISEKINKLLSREKKTSQLRLLIFGVTIGLFYILLSTGNENISVITLIIGLATLAYFMILSRKTTAERILQQHLLLINEKELDCINGNFHHFPNGSEYIQRDHPYSSDLDIFGESSVFQYINRTTSAPGSQRLAEWLKTPAGKEEILERQEAIKELSEKLIWRQQLMTLGYKYPASINDSTNIITWIHEIPVFESKKYIKPLINILSSLFVIAFIATFFGVSLGVLSIMILVNYYLAAVKINDVNVIHRSVSKSIDILKSYSETIEHIEKETFHSKKLLDLQKHFKQNDYLASEQIKYLSTLVNKLDYRLNLLVALPFNLIFWDIRISLLLEKWKQKHRDHISIWFDCMAEFEAISSIGNMSYNNQDWIMPEIAPDNFQFKAIDMGHPLISANKRINNTIEIEPGGKIILITGSNMSGKSTFLRTCGVNIVLAMLGAPVCARNFCISRNTVYTSMRIIDSLEENTSSFYAELKRLAMIIQTVDKNEKVFLLLDEILRGTNSNDRHIGSMALIHQLVKNNASGIIATHDLDLSKLEQELPMKLDNYNFDVKIENDELYFDYKLNKGVCKSLNASILMKKMGIRI